MVLDFNNEHLDFENIDSLGEEIEENIRFIKTKCNYNI